MRNDNIFRCGRDSEAGTAQLVDQSRNPSFTWEWNEIERNMYFVNISH